jgi:ketosteroid isomerase-like protein
MGKSVIVNLGVVALTVVMFCGCQILGSGPSDEDLVNATMADWKAALIAHDLDKLMETYSENYANTQGGDKDSVREFIAGVIDQGYLDNVKINLEDAQIKIEGDKADVGPVELTSDGGTYVLDYKLQKEQKAWLIVFSRIFPRTRTALASPYRSSRRMKNNRRYHNYRSSSRMKRNTMTNLGNSSRSSIRLCSRFLNRRMMMCRWVRTIRKIPKYGKRAKSENSISSLKTMFNWAWPWV